MGLGFVAIAPLNRDKERSLKQVISSVQFGRQMKRQLEQLGGGPVEHFGEKFWVSGLLVENEGLVDSVERQGHL